MNDINIVDVVKRAGVTLRPDIARVRWGRCIVCKNETSFTVNRARNFFHCFSCKVCGGPADFEKLVGGW